MNDLSLSDIAAWLDARPDARFICHASAGCGWDVEIIGARVRACAVDVTVGDAVTRAMTRYEERERGAA